MKPKSREEFKAEVKELIAKDPAQAGRNLRGIKKRRFRVSGFHNREAARIYLEALREINAAPEAIAAPKKKATEVKTKPEAEDKAAPKKKAVAKAKLKAKPKTK